MTQRHTPEKEPIFKKCGHPKIPENIRFRYDRGTYNCRTCESIRDKKHYRANRERICRLKREKAARERKNVPRGNF